MKQRESFVNRCVWFLRAMALIVIVVVTVAITTPPLLLFGLILPKRWLYTVWGRMGSFIVVTAAGVKLQVEGFDKVDDGEARFFVGNHQSLLDIVILSGVNHGDLRFMAKHTLFRTPLFGWMMYQYDFGRVDRSNIRKTLQSLSLMIERLKCNPVPFAVFPEGTRSIDDHLLPFKPGALKIVQRAGMPIVPFAIYGSGRVIRRGRWRVVPGVVKLAFSEPISAEEAASMSSHELCERVRQDVETEFDRLAESF